MGRHGQPARRGSSGRRAPWDLVGWGLFATVVGAGCVRWYGGSWQTAAAVAGTGLLALGSVVVLALLSGGGQPGDGSGGPAGGSSGRRRRPPP